VLEHVANNLRVSGKNSPPFVGIFTPNQFSISRWEAFGKRQRDAQGDRNIRRVAAGCRLVEFGGEVARFLAAACMPQQKVLEDEFPLAGPQRTAASTARYLTTIGFWAGLNLDDVVERAAMRTFKKTAYSRTQCAPLCSSSPWHAPAVL
jgi:hypothetical protein